MEKSNLPIKPPEPTPSEDIYNLTDPYIPGSHYEMQRAGQEIDLAIQTNTAIVTMIDGKIVRFPAAELIKKRQLTA